ncbi:PP2C family protein-serine/threonine phosphatase [Roseospira visakhapatnamensis]|uniref:Serine phosphatase RsbU (Regulator of sigma subunit)/HAMP domain-containing protein n=1 Tax=Roseospira visakhapatnamensis TaxID=390880 RepID=A0A7W6W956_9PROT|nr:SpoIIE family protein phosphatase [Roseospira visakhapatnamensis]MBB4265488.1 serine phosphatase RsbU (regulator of sigma subunit)/HAMP domain-containing protein [Roseospira visakhapatnamensis]
MTDPVSQDRMAAVPSVSVTPMSVWRGLTPRLALVTLLVALLVGLLGGALELAMDLRADRAEVVAELDRTVSLVRDSAAEAAFQLNPAIAEGVVDGLARNALVARVDLRDNFGGVLADLDRGAGPDGGLTGWFATLFSDVVHHREPLVYVSPTGVEGVGSLMVSLSPQALGERYRDRALATLAGGAARAAVISAILALVFLVLMVRPLSRLSVAIARVDPTHPAGHPIPAPRGHRRDELGHVAQALNALLRAFQHSLDARDKAEAALRALTEDLERRVALRTRDLEDAMDELAAEKEETEAAFARLDETHRALANANRLLLESIHYARRIQTSLLPDKTALTGLVRDLHVCWDPLDVVGGDYFWLERFDDDTALLLVADCTGHGVPGAFMTLVVASALDRALHDEGLRRPSDILRAIDGQVRARLRQDRPESDSDDGLEAAICLWDRRARTLTFAGAGLPLLYVEDGALREVRGDRAYLGYRTLPAPERFTDHVMTVRAGTAVYMPTDGVPDQMGGEPRRLLGRRRLGRIIVENQGLPMAEQLAAIQRELEAYRGDEPRRDDMTMIGFIPL